MLAKSRVLHFAPGQTLWMGFFHLLYSSEAQSSHSAPSLAFNLQGDPVFGVFFSTKHRVFVERQSTDIPVFTRPQRSLIYNVSIHPSTSPNDSLGDRAARSSMSSSDRNLLFGECQVVAIPKGFLEVEG